MTLIAIKKISARLPAGQEFTATGSRAKLLIALGLARAVDGAESPRPRRGRRRLELEAEPA